MPIRTFNVGVKAVIIKDNKLLIVRHRTKGFWDIPGGRIDDNEAVDETLRREIGEELPSATDIEIGDILCAYRMPGLTLEDGSGLLLLAYRVKVRFPDDTIVLSDEHSDVRWATFDEARATGSPLLGKVVAVLSK